MFPCVVLCVPLCSYVSLCSFQPIVFCVFLCVPVFPFVFLWFSLWFLCFPGFLCSPVFPCVFLLFTVPMWVHVLSFALFSFIWFHLFSFCFHCHCFIWVQLFQKQSWECAFNSSWFKTPFGQYAYKVFLLFFENHSFIENHFFTRQSAFLDSFVLLCSLVFSTVPMWVHVLSFVLFSFPVFSFIFMLFPLSLFHLG